MASELRELSREEVLQILRDTAVRAFMKADLRNADLRGMSLSYANLARALLSHADLMGAGLEGANLAGAQLVGTALVEAHLMEANLALADSVSIPAMLWKGVIQCHPKCPHPGYWAALRMPALPHSSSL